MATTYFEAEAVLHKGVVQGDSIHLEGEEHTLVGAAVHSLAVVELHKIEEHHMGHKAGSNLGERERERERERRVIERSRGGEGSTQVSFTFIVNNTHTHCVLCNT